MFKFVFLAALLVVSATAAHFPGIPQSFTADNEVLSALADDVANKLEEEYMIYLKTGVETEALLQITNELSQMHNQKDLFIKEVEELSTSSQFLMCSVCRATIRVAAKMFREEDGELNGPHNEQITKRIMLDVCNRLKLQTEEVCGGLFDSNWPTAFYIIQNTPETDSQTFCSLFMEKSFCNVKSPHYLWSLKVDSKEAAAKDEKPAKADNDICVLQLSDMHFDPLYEPGSLAVCAEPLCCQRNKTETEGTSNAAGKWGDYRDCDAPEALIDNALAHIKSKHSNCKYIYQTGDVVDHMVWATSLEKNQNVLSRISKKLKDTFDATVYPCIGNHEPHPLNVFSPEDIPGSINTKWLYEHLYEVWNLPEETKETILKGGYYTVSPEPGFRIIALNNNDCYNMNWWLFYKGTDKQIQLQWLHDTLLKAEENKEHVHILAHIPSGDGSCWSNWAEQYTKIIARFSDTISGVFNGHSHKDEMNVFYSEGHPVGIAWNGGALTPFSDKNPNYRVYEIETKTWQVVDHETWIMHLDKANENGGVESPEWIKEYTFSEEFTDDLSPNGIDTLLNKMADRPALLRKFWQYKHTMATPRMNAGCDSNCLVGTICRIATTVNNQTARCDELSERLRQGLENEKGEGEEDEDDGASSMIAFSLSSILGFMLLMKVLF